MMLALAAVLLSVLLQQFGFVNLPILGVVPQLTVIVMVLFAASLKPAEIIWLGIFAGILFDALVPGGSLWLLVLFTVFGLLLALAVKVVSKQQSYTETETLKLSMALALAAFGAVLTTGVSSVQFVSAASWPSWGQFVLLTTLITLFGTIAVWFIMVRAKPS